MPAVKGLGNTVTWFVPLGLKSWFEDCGIDKQNVVELDWGEQVVFRNAKGSSCLVTCLPCRHWSRRTLTDYNRTLWASWAVQGSRYSVFFGGDSGYHKEFSLIGNIMGPFDLALIGIGAYKPREMMHNSHTSPSDAVQVHIDLKAKVSVGMHWGCWILSWEDVLQPPVDLSEALTKAGLPQSSFITLPIGGSLEFKD